MKTRHRQAMRMKLVLRDAIDDTHQDCGDCPHVDTGCPQGLCSTGSDRLDAAFEALSLEQQARAQTSALRA